MQFGVFSFLTDETIGPAQLARAAEERGFESLFLPEHTHIPVAETAFPGGREVPRRYQRTLDPFVALGAAAAVTERIAVGTAVCLVVERDPIVLAKEVATLDHLSGGRVIFGVGGGWNRAEMAHHGTDPSGRFALLRERIAAMKAIWTGDPAEFHGRYVDFGPIHQWPKPVQQPHPPILVGGSGPNVLRRVVDYGDGWFPILSGQPGELAGRIAELGRLAADRGRPPIPVSLFRAPQDPDGLRRCAELGVQRCVFDLPSAGVDEVLPALDRCAELAAAAADG